MSAELQSFGTGGTQALTDAATITLDLASTPGNSFSVTLGGNRTLNILNQIPGQKIDLYVTQDGTGSRTLAVKSNGTSAVVSTGTLLTTTAGAVDLIQIAYRATLGYSFVYPLGKAFS